MKNDEAFMFKLISLCLSGMLFSNVEAQDENIEGQRKGWKTNGNGFFVYKTSTSFGSTKQITIKGTFSTLPNITGKNMLIAAEDGSGYNFLQYWVENGYHWRSIGGLSISQNLTGITSGSVFHFNLEISETLNDEGGYDHNVKTTFEEEPSNTIGFGNSNEKEAWNLDNVTFFIGGYNSTSENYFHGCLSDFIFDGVDIIETYFDQYPNNLNPTKGQLEIGDFSNQPETCDDLTTTTTVSPTTNPTIESTTTQNSSLGQQSTNCFVQFLLIFTILISRNIQFILLLPFCVSR